MIQTVGLNDLFAALFDAYGDGVSVEFVEMDDREKAESSGTVEGMEFRLVRDQFFILETGLAPGAHREKDLEQVAFTRRPE
jgi:hypothetical protein